jgi:hypothetical protein
MVSPCPPGRQPTSPLRLEHLESGVAGHIGSLDVAEVGAPPLWHQQFALVLTVFVGRELVLARSACSRGPGRRDGRCCGAMFCRRLTSMLLASMMVWRFRSFTSRISRRAANEESRNGLAARTYDKEVVPTT